MISKIIWNDSDGDYLDWDSHGVHGQATLTLKSDNVPEDRKRIERYGGKILGKANAPYKNLVNHNS